MRGALILTGVARLRFRTRLTGLVDARNHYSVTADGQRFLVITTVEESEYSPVSVIVNWPAALKR